MATTTEQFLVQIGLDPASVQKLLSGIQNAKTQAEATEITLQVTSNVPEVADEVGVAAQQAGLEADQAMAQFEDGIRDVEGALDDLKKGMLAIAAVSAAIGGFGFAQAAQESTAYARANVILQFTQEELLKTQEQLRAVADETNQSYVEVADSLFQVASAGFEGADAIEAVTAASKAATPAGIAVGVAFDAIATVMNNFGGTAEEAGDKLVRISDLTRGTLANVSSALGQISPTAAAAGISLDEVGASFALITSKGEAAEVASTLLFNAINAFLAPSEEAKKQFTELGIAFGDTAFQSQTLADKVGILSLAAEEGRVQIGELFNIRAARGLRPLINDTEGLSRNLQAVQKSAGRTAEGLEAFLASAGPQLTAFTTAVKNTATALGTDLLEAIAPTATSLAAFVQDNRELIKLLLKVGLTITGLTAAWIGYKLITTQVRAATLLVTGVTKALNAVLTFETATLGTNVKAWAAKLASETAAAQTPIVRFIRTVIGILTVETGAVLASAAAWAKRTALGLLGAIIAGGKVFIALLSVIPQIALETLAIKSNTIARQANNLAASDTTGILKTLSAALRTNVKNLSAAATAAGVVGAAIAGWKLGKAIDEWLGLGKAAAAVVNGTATGAQKIKNAILGSLIPPLGLANAYFADQAQAARNAAEVLTGPMQKALNETAGAQEKYNELLARGVDNNRAFLAAIGTLKTELAILNDLEAKGKLTTQDLARRAEIVALLRDRNEDIANTKRRILTLDQALKTSQDVLNKTAAEWATLVARVGDEYAKLQTGVLAESLLDVENFEKDFDLILDRVTAFTAELGAQEERRRQLVEEGSTSAALEANATAIEDTTKRIADTQAVLDQQIAITQRRILDNTKTFVSDLRQSAEEETAVYKEAADAQIAIERRKVDEIERELQKLVALRDRSVADAERFIERLEEAELRRRDTNLADIIRLEQQFNAVVKQGIATEEQRIRILQALRTELERLAAPTREEIQLQEKLASIRKQIQDLEGEDEGVRLAERRADLVEKQTELTADLADEEAKREIRRKEAESALTRATDASSAALDAFAKREAAIVDLENQRQTLEQNILNIRTQLAAEEAKINTELATQLQRVDDIAKKQLGVLETAKEYVALLGQMRQEEPAAFKAAVGGIQEQFTSAIQQVQKLVQEPISEESLPLEELQKMIEGSTEIAAWLKDLKGNLETVSTNINAQKDVIVPAAQEVTQTFSDLEGIFEPSVTSIERMLAATQGFAPQIESFSTEVVEKLTSAAARLEQTTARVAQVERRLDAIPTTSGGGANGLPN